MQQFGRNANELIKQAAKRQLELKDPQLRDDLAAARAVLKKHSTMLLTASKVYVRHPELDLAKVNRDYVLKQVCEAVNTISDVAQGKSSQPIDMFNGAGELAAALDDFDEGINMDPLAYNEVRSRPTLEERLESIISAAALMADADCTRDERRERIVAECNAVRQALQDLLSAYMSNVSRKYEVFFLSSFVTKRTTKLIMIHDTQKMYCIIDGPKGEEFNIGYGHQSNVPEDA